MTTADLVDRTARTLQVHRVSLAEHYLMCSAGYRVTLPPDAFVAHAFAASTGDPRGSASLSDLTVALEHLQQRGLLSQLTPEDLREEKRRRAMAMIPEVLDGDYEVGCVDFTRRGYLLHREMIGAIHGAAFLATSDAGFNLDVHGRRFDVYAVSAEDCRRLMNAIETGSDDYTGMPQTRFVAREGPIAIGTWKPDRFGEHDTGYHGILQFDSGAALEPHDLADGAP